EYSAARAAEFLECQGFEVERGICGLPTAFQANVGRGGLHLAFCAEYDALPPGSLFDRSKPTSELTEIWLDGDQRDETLRHACGHNLIAAGGLGAALAVGSIKADLPGKLIFMGTPAEEGGGGKVVMIDAGLFEEVDVAMMFHPANYTLVGRGSLAITEVRLEFHGKPSHASGSPEKGINALDAVIQTFNGINALRQHIRDDARIHGIISHGGLKPNIVPEFAAADFYVRAKDNDYRDELLGKLRRCAEGAALATGARLDFIEVGHAYKAMKPNKILGGIFLKHVQASGLPHTPTDDKAMGSTDMGDVTQIVPGIHPYVKIAESDVAGHSREFAEASKSERGQVAMLAAAKAMAMTTVNLLEDAQLVARIWEEFRTT
ncbi:amidohydrolase, partial [Candidatus Bipolaricaulota bacterium]|nr:amidohydrolase [Candidatus Bipolaricaulota bacterium]